MSLLSFFGVKSLAAETAGMFDPIHNFWYGPVGHRTAGGVAVNEYVAMTYSACWACTMLLSTSGGMLPLKLHRKLRGGGSEELRDDPRHGLVHAAPNPEMPSMMFRSSRIAQQINRGNCFAEIERTRGRRPIALWPIHASRIPAMNIKRENGKLVYYVNNDDGSKTPIDAADILHVPSPISEDGIIGRGVVEHARLTIGLGIATETQGAAYFGNSARPKVVIKGAKFKDKSDREDFRQQWDEVHGGPENNARPALLPEGSDITTLSFSAEDSQFLETRQHNTEEVARWYGVPPHMIGHLLRSTFNNIEQQSMEFVKYSLMRWLVLWEQELNRKLLTPEERGTLFFRHSVDALERADLQTRTTALKEQFFNGKITLNDWRAKDDENPIGPLGDIHFVQSAMIPLETAAKGPPEKESPGDPPPPAAADSDTEIDDESDLSAEVAILRDQVATLTVALQQQEASCRQSLEAATASAEIAQREAAAAKTLQQRLASASLRDVLSRMLSVEINAVKRVAEKPSRFDARLREFYDKHAGTLERNIADPIAVLLTAHADERDAAVLARQYAERHVAESLKQLDALLDCQAEELSRRVEQCVSKWHEERAGINLEDMQWN